MGSREKKKKREQKKREQKKREQKKRAYSLKPGFPLEGFPPGALIVAPPAGERKMSEVLLEFVEPYSEEWRTAEEVKKLLSVALVAWNAALYSGSKREQLIQQILEVVPPEVRSEMRAIIEKMIQRKVSHFASNRRMIVDYKVTMTREGPHLSVVSTLEIA